jgi:large subunit ribosomal protein L25
MAMQELTIKRREGSGKGFAKRLRREGAVPAVLYDGKKAESVTVDPKVVLRMIHGHEGTTQLLTLRFDGENGNGTRLAIIREMQFDPVTELLLHVDLQEVAADRAITVQVAVRATGEAAGVREQKGILNLVLHELTVSCLPTAIPERIDADVSALMIGDVLTVAPPMAEEVAAVAAPAAAAVTEPEVLTERKPKEGEEAAADDGKKPARPARGEKSEKDK